MSNEDNATTEISRIVDEPITEGQMVTMFGDNFGLQEVHSFDMSDPWESILYVNAVSGDAKPLRRLPDGEIEIVYYYCRPITFVAGKDDPRYAEGELIHGERCVLVAPNGEQYCTTSPTAIKTIAAIHKTAIGKKKFNPPIRLRVGMAKTRNGFDTQTLTVVPTDRVS